MTSYPMAGENIKKLKIKKVSRIVVVERARRISVVTLRELRGPNKEQMQVRKEKQVPF